MIPAQPFLPCSRCLVLRPKDQLCVRDEKWTCIDTHLCDAMRNTHYGGTYKHLNGAVKP